jgi:hypothetical protein
MTSYTKIQNPKFATPAEKSQGLTRRPVGLRVKTRLKAGESIRLNFTKV